MLVRTYFAEVQKKSKKKNKKKTHFHVGLFLLAYILFFLLLFRCFSFLFAFVCFCFAFLFWCFSRQAEIVLLKHRDCKPQMSCLQNTISLPGVLPGGVPMGWPGKSHVFLSTIISACPSGNSYLDLHLRRSLATLTMVN